MTNLDVGLGSARVGVLEKPKVIKGSIIKAKYKKEYKKLGGLCGDDVSCELTNATTVGADDKGNVKTCLKALREIAVLNGVWKESYGRLNPGQQRMTVGNCLRHKMERGDRIVIGKRTMGGEDLEK